MRLKTYRLWHTLAASLFCLSLSACGGGSDGSPVQEQAPTPSISLLAGAFNSPGNSDGPASNARFHDPALIIQNTEGGVFLALHSGPTNMAGDKNGNLYVLDAPHQIISTYQANPDYNKGMPIRKISPAGNVSTLLTIKVPNSLTYLAVDSKNALYFTSYGKIYKVSPEETETVFLVGTSASQSEYTPVSPTTQPFQTPGPIVFDSDDNLYVSDGPYIRKMLKDGTSQLLATLPSNSGATTSMTIDANGNLYLTQASVQSQPGHVLMGTNRSMIIKVKSNGEVAVIAGTAEGVGYVDGAGTQAQFSNPTGIAVDETGNLYVADMGNQVIRKIDVNGVVSTVAGTAGVSTSGTGMLPGTLANPYGLRLIGPKTLAVTTGTAVAKIVLP